MTGDEHINFEFATTWPEYDLDAKTKALLSYAGKLTEAPSLIDKSNIDSLRENGWNENEIWEITALVSFFNFSGRMEAASGLPHDQIPDNAKFNEAKSY